MKTTAEMIFEIDVMLADVASRKARCSGRVAAFFTNRLERALLWYKKLLLEEDDDGRNVRADQHSCCGDSCGGHSPYSCEECYGCKGDRPEHKDTEDNNPV